MISDLFVPVLTPFTREGTVDDRALAAHCEWLLAEGASGVMLFGTTGEGPSLSVDEKVTAAAILLAAVPGIQVIATVAESSLTDTVNCLRRYNDLAIQASMLLPPGYFREPWGDGIERFLDAAATASTHPIFGYHIPSMAPAIPPSYFKDSPYVGVKDSGGDLDYTREVLAGGKISFVGAEPLVPDAIAAGAAGTIAGMGNLLPSHMARICRAARAGDLETAYRLRDDVIAVQQAVLAEAPGHEFVSAFKDIVRRLHGTDMGDARLPLMRRRTYLTPAVITALESHGAKLVELD
jgi:4-hydroxy-tetrahydrodipicolinate synthase